VLGSLEFFEQDVKTVVTHRICRLQLNRGHHFGFIESRIRGILGALK
jgi:hypothetical protein